MNVVHYVEEESLSSRKKKNEAHAQNNNGELINGQRSGEGSAPRKYNRRLCNLARRWQSVIFNNVTNQIKNKVLGKYYITETKTLIYADDIMIWGDSKQELEMGLIK